MTSWLHADVVWLFSGLLIAAWFLIRLQLIPESSRPMLIGLTAMTVIQAIVGYTQFFTNLPAALVAFHVLGAVIIWNYTLNLARHIQFDAGVRNSRP
jgi:cytochrome c oxidase assembly protein subunit 15